MDLEWKYHRRCNGNHSDEKKYWLLKGHILEPSVTQVYHEVFTSNSHEHYTAVHSCFSEDGWHWDTNIRNHIRVNRGMCNQRESENCQRSSWSNKSFSCWKKRKYTIQYRASGEINLFASLTRHLTFCFILLWLQC